MFNTIRENFLRKQYEKLRKAKEEATTPTESFLAGLDYNGFKHKIAIEVMNDKVSISFYEELFHSNKEK